MDSRNHSWLFFDKEETAYEMRISDWSADVCSSDLAQARQQANCTKCARIAELLAEHEAAHHREDPRLPVFGRGPLGVSRQRSPSSVPAFVADRMSVV